MRTRIRSATPRRHPRPPDVLPKGAASASPSPNPRPLWKALSRELHLGDRVVVRLRRPAPCLELLFAAFQEGDWAEFIDDPLPPKHGTDPKERLRDAIKRLNQCQEPHLIRVHGNGTGQGVGWKLNIAKADMSHRSATDEPQMSPGGTGRDRV